MTETRWAVADIVVEGLQRIQAFLLAFQWARRKSFNYGTFSEAGFLSVKHASRE
jgi:hypothetical protein